MRWRLQGRVPMVLGGIWGGLCLAELGLRLCPPGGATALVFGAPDGLPPDAYRGDPELFQEPVPGWSGEVRGLEYSIARAGPATESGSAQGPRYAPFLRGEDASPRSAIASPLPAALRAAGAFGALLPRRIFVWLEDFAG